MSRAHAIPTPRESVLNLMLDPVSRCLDAESARKLFDVRIEPAVQERVDEFAGKPNDGLLTDPERAEYEAYINTDDFIAILKPKARRYLAASDVS